MDDAKYDLVESLPLTAPMAAAAAQYWTPARIATIQPIPLRTITRQRGEAAAARAALAGPVAGGRTLIALSTPPKSASLAASGVSNADTARVSDMTAPPFCFVGKLLHTHSSGYSVSTAWVIGKKAILTAGHCVFDHGFASSIQFLPQFRNGTAPQAFTAVKMTTLREFAENDDLRYSIGACILDRPIDDLTGVCGYVVNPNPLTGKLVNVGYPTRPQDGFPFDGEMWRSIGDVASDQAPGTTTDRSFGMFSDLTAGAGGSPWFTTGSTPLAVGLSSHILSDSAGNPADVPRQMRSPYFGAAFLRILKWIRDNGGEPNEPSEFGAAT